MIDKKTVISEFSKTELRGNTDGIIPYFDMTVSCLPFHFWNTFSEKCIRKTRGNKEAYQEVISGLETAAAEYGYHTGHHIITSDEFIKTVGPLNETEPGDILAGVYALFAVWGWADVEIIELSSSRMVLRSEHYYEAAIRDTLRVDTPCACLISGVSRALMDLLYGEPYPDGFDTFTCLQTHGIEAEEMYGEFVVTRRTQ